MHVLDRGRNGAMGEYMSVYNAGCKFDTNSEKVLVKSRIVNNGRRDIAA